MPLGGIDDEGIDFIASVCTLLQEIFQGLHWNVGIAMPQWPSDGNCQRGAQILTQRNNRVDPGVQPHWQLLVHVHSLTDFFWQLFLARCIFIFLISRRHCIPILDMAHHPHNSAESQKHPLMIWIEVRFILVSQASPQHSDLIGPLAILQLSNFKAHHSKMGKRSNHGAQ